MQSNRNFNAARANKNDEFYTALADVENELRHYTQYFSGKTVLCNCNDGESSAFWQYFSANFTAFDLKRLIAVKYGAAACGYVLEMERVNGVLLSRKKILYGNGDFRSDESIELLKQADVVITNPPFTLFREYIALLTKHKKKFLVIGNMNAMTFSEVFPYIRDNKFSLGFNGVGSFTDVNGEVHKFGNVVWFTNLSVNRNRTPIQLTQSYSPEKYPHYDNYNAINVDRVAHIPKDYYGVMGVPVSFLTKYDPRQFEIIGITGERKHTIALPPEKLYFGVLQHCPDGTVKKSINVNRTTVLALRDKPENKFYYTAENAEGFLVCLYARILIRRK